MELDDYLNRYNQAKPIRESAARGELLETFPEGKKYFWEKNLIDLTAAS